NPATERTSTETATASRASEQLEQNPRRSQPRVWLRPSWIQHDRRPRERCRSNRDVSVQVDVTQPPAGVVLSDRTTGVVGVPADLTEATLRIVIPVTFHVISIRVRRQLERLPPQVVGILLDAAAPMFVPAVKWLLPVGGVQTAQFLRVTSVDCLRSSLD